MAYKRYVHKKGKRHGPYYYKNVRDDTGKVRTVYLGRVSGRSKRPLEVAIVFLVVLLTVISSLFFIQNRNLVLSKKAVEESKVPFEVDQILTKVLVKENEYVEKELRVMNVEDIEASINIDVEGISHLVNVLDKEFTIKPGQTKIVRFNFTSFDKNANIQQAPGVYIGKIIAKTESYEKEVPLVVEIESKTVLFDMNLNPVARDRSVKQGESTTFEIRVFNLQSIDSYNIEMNFFVKDINGNTIVSERESVVVKTQASFFKTLKIPEKLRTGNYVFVAQASLGNSIGTASYLFDVETAIKENKFLKFAGFCRNDPLCWALSIIVMLLLFSIGAYAYFFFGVLIYQKLFGIGITKRKESAEEAFEEKEKNSVVLIFKDLGNWIRRAKADRLKRNLEYEKQKIKLRGEKEKLKLRLEQERQRLSEGEEQRRLEIQKQRELERGRRGEEKRSRLEEEIRKKELQKRKELERKYGEEKERKRGLLGKCGILIEEGYNALRKDNVGKADRIYKKLMKVYEYLPDESKADVFKDINSFYKSLLLRKHETIQNEEKIKEEKLKKAEESKKLWTARKKKAFEFFHSLGLVMTGEEKKELQKRKELEKQKKAEIKIRLEEDRRKQEEEKRKLEERIRGLQKEKKDISEEDKQKLAKFQKLLDIHYREDEKKKLESVKERKPEKKPLEKRKIGEKIFSLFNSLIKPKEKKQQIIQKEEKRKQEEIKNKEEVKKRYEEEKGKKAEESKKLWTARKKKAFEFFHSIGLVKTEKEKKEKVREEKNKREEEERKEEERRKQRELEKQKRAEEKIRLEEERKKHREEQRKKKVEEYRKKEEESKKQKELEIKRGEEESRRNEEERRRKSQERRKSLEEIQEIEKSIEEKDAKIKQLKEKINDEINSISSIEKNIPNIQKGTEGLVNEKRILFKMYDNGMESKRQLSEEREAKIVEWKQRYDAKVNEKNQLKKEVKEQYENELNEVKNELENLSPKEKEEQEKWKKLEVKAKYKLEEKAREREIEAQIKNLLEEKKNIEQEFKGKKSGIVKGIDEREILEKQKEIDEHIRHYEKEAEELRKDIESKRKLIERYKENIGNLEEEKGKDKDLLLQKKKDVGGIGYIRAIVKSMGRIKPPEKRLRLKEEEPEKKEWEKRLLEVKKKQEERKKLWKARKKKAFEFLHSIGLVKTEEEKKELQKKREEEKKFRDEEKKRKEERGRKEEESKKQKELGIKKKEDKLIRTSIFKKGEEIEERQKGIEAKRDGKSRKFIKCHSLLVKANQAISNNDIKKAKMLYVKARDVYIKLDYYEKKEIYQELTELYNKLKNY